MRRDQELFEDEGKTRGVLSGNDSRRSPKEAAKGVPGDSSSDDEIIELVDVVGKGDDVQEIGTDDLALLLDEEGDSEEGGLYDEKADEDSDGFSHALEEAPSEALESNLRDRSEPLDDTFDSPDFDFETPEDLEESSADALSEIPQEDLAEVMAGLTDEIEARKTEPAAIGEELPAISTERFEEIITEVVKDVVERVTRETMAEVAEKVIKEAIEGLKQSLEPTPE